jgi:hypothetical protein
MAVAAGLGVGIAASVSITARVMPGLICRPLADARAVIPLVAVAALDGVTAQTQDFLQLVENLRRGNRILPPATVDLTDPQGDEPAGVRTAPRVLSLAV